MTDIIEQMRSLDRDTYDWFAVVDKAADEIERLREQVTGRSGYEFVSSMADMSETMTRQRLEIERLRASLNTISHLADDEETMGCSGYDHEQMHMAVAIARCALEQKP